MMMAMFSYTHRKGSVKGVTTKINYFQ